MRKRMQFVGMWVAVALNCTEAHAAEADKTAAADAPDEKLLEFLGSEDSEDEVWDEYLAEIEPARPDPEVTKDE